MGQLPEPEMRSKGLREILLESQKRQVYGAKEVGLHLKKREKEKEKKKQTNKRNKNEMTKDHVMDDHVTVKLLHNI